ncbi:MAG: hypothetical protein K6C34_01295 [Alphaproteobacteria bacterium]|nr:hypothetical protein [Alphaproteobacteria bacterium]
MSGAVENPFFSSEHKLTNVSNEISPFDWFISADKIFASNVEGFKDYSKFYEMEFRVARSSLFDFNRRKDNSDVDWELRMEKDGWFNKTKVSDSAIVADDVKIYMAPGRHCAMLQGRMAKGVVIPKITIKKTQYISGEIAVLETKEFLKCVIQSFERKGELVTFTFRYITFSDSYTDFKEDGTKLGNAAAKIDLSSWKIENS